MRMPSSSPLLLLDHVDSLDDLLAHVVYPSSIRFARTIESYGIERRRLVGDLERHGVVPGLEDLAAHAAAPRRDLRVDPDRDAPPHGGGEVRGLAQAAPAPARTRRSKSEPVSSSRCVTRSQSAWSTPLGWSMYTERLGEISSTASTRSARRRSTAGAISSWSSRSRVGARHRYSIPSKQWARRAHFVKPVKCGGARIAPGSRDQAAATSPTPRTTTARGDGLGQPTGSRTTRPRTTAMRMLVSRTAATAAGASDSARARAHTRGTRMRRRRRMPGRFPPARSRVSPSRCARARPRPRPARARARGTGPRTRARSPPCRRGVYAAIVAAIVSECRRPGRPGRRHHARGGPHTDEDDSERLPAAERRATDAPTSTRTGAAPRAIGYTRLRSERPYAVVVEARSRRSRARRRPRSTAGPRAPRRRRRSRCEEEHTRTSATVVAARTSRARASNTFQAHGAPPHRAPARVPRPALEVQHDRHGAVVDERDFHARAEQPRARPRRSRLRRPRGRRDVRPSALARVDAADDPSTVSPGPWLQLDVPSGAV